jgi:predicted amidohydrolase
VGLTERRNEGNFNTAILIDPAGAILLQYSKINLLEVEFPFYGVGDRLAVVRTSLGTLGLDICSDNYLESVHIGKTLACMGAEIILSPSSWTVPYHVTERDEPYADKWTRPLCHIAQYYDTVIVSTTSVGYIVGGPYEGRKMVGKSLAVGPDGVIAEGQFNEFAGELHCFEIPRRQRNLKGTQFGEHARRLGLNFERSVR